MRIGKEEFLCSAKHLADRLEQLERDLEAFKAFHERYAEQTSKKYVHDICALTDRAEKAEAERDAIIKTIRDDEWCAYCGNDRGLRCEFRDICDEKHDMYSFRGLRGKENDGNA